MNFYEVRRHLHGILMMPIAAWLFVWLADGSRQATAMLPYTALLAAGVAAAMFGRKLFEHVDLKWERQVTLIHNVVVCLVFTAAMLALLFVSWKLHEDQSERRAARAMEAVPSTTD